MACAWATALSDGKRPVSWAIYERLRRQGIAGILVPSFAPGIGMEDRNLVLWDWGRICRIRCVFDPSDRLPKDQLSWRSVQWQQGRGLLSLKPGLAQADPKLVAMALVFSGHFGGGMAKLLLHVVLVDLGRGG